MTGLLRAVHDRTWPAWPFLLIAIALVVTGAAGPAQAAAALVAAGAALLGAAATKVADLDTERHEAIDRDMDETRRLAYTALMSQGSRSYYLAATVANALAHHQHTASADEALEHLRALADGNNPGGQSEAWLKQQIDTINTRLGDNPPVIPPAEPSLPTG
jgi:hypothetical protein